MDLRLVVGGLITRNPALSTLLLNYADRVAEPCTGHGTAAAPCFIVPTWSVDPCTHAGPDSLEFTVEAHTSDPDRLADLDTILRLTHAALTDDHANASITARRLDTPADPVAGDRDTIVRTATWSVALVTSFDRRAIQRRLVPWPDCSTTAAVIGALTPSAVSMN